MFACLLALLLTRTSFADVWINEFHYDNNGGDSNEFIEIVLDTTSGISVSNISLELYRDDGMTYGSVHPLASFTAGSMVGAYQFYSLSLPTNGLQNGPSDGFGLLNASNVVQLLSYEGTFTGASGTAAAGMTSIDIGVSESDSTSNLHSLYLTGAGSMYSDFSWTSGSASPGGLNTGQSFSAVPEPSAFLFGGIALGLVGAWRFAKRNWVAAK